MSEVWNPILKYPVPNFYLSAALRILGVSKNAKDWAIYSVKVMDGGALVVVGKVTVYTKGPKKGQSKPCLREDMKEVLVSDAEFLAEKAAFVENGRCMVCYGNGLVWNGWNRERGERYIKCPRCVK